MKIRKTGTLLIVIVIACGISPALADCCSNVLDCAATVVTEGLSCEVETLLSTIKTLMTVIQNLGDDVTGKTQNAQQSARKFVSDTINTIQSQSQQNASDLAAAQTQAETIYREEMAPTATGSLATGHAQNDVPASVRMPSSPGAPAPLSELANHTAANAPHAASSAPMSALANDSAAHVPVVAQSGTPGIGLQKSSVNVGTQATTNAESQLAPHGKYADAFARGVKEITALKGTGDTDLNQVNQYLVMAQQSEGPGVAAANTLAGALTAPITDMTSELTSMLENPLKAYDPTAHVNSIEQDIESHLNVNIQTMIQDITAGPTQQFIAAMPAFADLGGNAVDAKAIAAAMDRLYKSRTPAAAEALYELLPQQQYAGLTSRAAATGRLNTPNGQRMSSGAIDSNIVRFKQQALLPVKLPNFDPIHTAVAQYQAQRAEAQSNRTSSMVQTYRSNFSHQMDGLLAGKTPAGIVSQRDQLIAQARTRFSKDPNTGNGVIALISSEADKHGARQSSVPVPSAPAMTTAAAAKSAPAPITSPAAAMTSVKPQTGLAPAATSSVAPVIGAPSQPKVPTWGTTPAWNPGATAGAPTAAAGASAMTTGAPVAPHAVTAIKPAIPLKSIQPVQRPAQQPAVPEPAPSLMTSH